MARTSSKPKTFAICYGFVGGPRHARHFNEMMQQEGYKLAEPSDADIIIAHSAGCWLLPASARPKLLVYIGMPLTTARKRSAWLAANASDFSHNPWRSLQVRFRNIYYWVIQPRRNLDILLHPKIGSPIIIPKTPAVFIANHHDPWPRVDDYSGFTDKQNWAFLNMEGTHDDMWEHSELYVQIIDYYAGLLG